MPRKHMTLQREPFRSKLQPRCGELGISGRTKADNVFTWLIQLKSKVYFICPHSFPASGFLSSADVHADSIEWELKKKHLPFMVECTLKGLHAWLCTRWSGMWKTKCFLSLKSTCASTNTYQILDATWGCSLHSSSMTPWCKSKSVPQFMWSGLCTAQMDSNMLCQI